MKINNERFSVAFCSAMDALGITTEDLAERFADIIEDRFEFFEQLLGDDNE